MGFNFAARASRSALDSDKADLAGPLLVGAKADAAARIEKKIVNFIVNLKKEE